MPAKSKTKTGQQGNVVASAPAEPQSASAFNIETVSSYGGIVVAVVFFCALRKIYYDYVWWDARNEQAREVLFESESALYYSYMKDVVNAPSFLEGIKGLLWHNRTEYPYEMNVIRRFNIFQEIVCAALYKICPIPCAPITFYVNAIFALWAAGMGWMFSASVRITRNPFSGFVAIALIVGNWPDIGRVCHLPPLRENQSIPLLLLQFLVTTDILRRCTTDGESATLTGREMKMLTIVTAAYMLPWQLAHTLMCVQTLAIYALYLLGCIAGATAGAIFVCFFAALMIVMALHCGGNAMFLWNSNFAQSCVACILLFYVLHNLPGMRRLCRPPVDGFSNGVMRVMYIVGNLVLFFAVWFAVRYCFELVIVSDEEKHIREFLKARFGFVKDWSTLDEALSVRQYLSDSVYSYLPDNMRNNLINHWMIPTLATAAVAVLISLVHDVLLSNGKRKVKTDDDKSSPQKPAMWASPDEVYLLLLNIAFCTMAAVMMRNLSIAGPFAAMMCSTLFSAKISRRILPSKPTMIGLAAVVGFVVALFTLTDAGETFHFKLFGASQNTAPGLGTEYDKLEIAELNWWIKTHTTPDAVFTGDMKTSSQIKCGTARPITCHPQYESKDVRRRDRMANQIFGKRTTDEIYGIMEKLHAEYVLVPLSSCWMKFGDGTSLATMTNDGIRMEEGKEKFDEVRGHLPDWCSTLPKFLDNKNPYFEVVYASSRYMILRLVPKEESSWKRVPYPKMAENDEHDPGAMLCDLAAFYGGRIAQNANKAREIWSKATKLPAGRGAPPPCGCRYLQSANAPPEAFTAIDWARVPAKDTSTAGTHDAMLDHVHCVGEAAYGAEQQKDHRLAEKMYRLTVALSPEDKQQWSNLGAYLSDMGKKDEANRAFDRAFRAHRGTTGTRVSTACNWAVNAYLAGKKVQAAAVLKDAVALYDTIKEDQQDNDFSCIQYYLQGKHQVPKDLHLQ